MSESFNYTEHIFRSPKFRSVVEEAVDFFIQTPLQILPPPVRFIGGEFMRSIIWVGMNCTRTCRNSIKQTVNTRYM